MTIRVIGFHYELKDKEGAVLDSSNGGAPFYFLENHQQIIPGLEKVLTAMKAGEKKLVEVKASEAYGEFNPELRVTVNKNQFPAGKEIQVGDRFQVNYHPQNPVFEVIMVENDNVTIDGNHPLAGKDLFFNVEIMEVRSATNEEISHGHAHGPNGHHHH